MTSGPRGFILATSLLVLALLTVMLTAAFVMISAEYRTTDNAAASARALAIAEAGLQNYLSLNRGLFATNTYDSTRITVTGGYADVVAQRVRAVSGGTPSLWSLRSTGYPTLGLPSGTPVSKRTVARLAHLYPGQLPARAALVALNGVQLAGTATNNPITGTDYVGSQPGCTSPGTPLSDSFAVSVYRNLVTPQYQPGASPPALGGKGLDESVLSQSELYDSTHINWVALRDTTYANFTPDYTIPPSGLIAPGPTTNYTVGYAPGNLTLSAVTSYTSNPRKGVLVVGGDLTVEDDTHWDGVILVGGRLIISPFSASTNYIIDGQVITGLNTQLSPPQSVGFNVIPRTSTGYTATRLAWSWCYATIAAQSLSGFAPIRRAWTDGWSLY